MRALRIGVLAESGDRFAFWERRLFNALCSDPCFDLCAIVTAPAGAAKANAAFRVLMRAETPIFAREPAVDDSAFRKAQSVIPIIPATDAERLSSLNLDVVLKHAGGAIPDAVAKAARHGVWSFDFNLGANDDRALAGFWEVHDRAAVTPVLLVAFTSGDDPGRMIASGRFNTKFSASRNAIFMKDKATALLLRELGRLAGGAVSGKEPPFVPSRPRRPGIGSLARYAAGVASNVGGRVVDAIAARIGARPGMWFLRAGTGELHEFNPANGFDIVPEKNRYWADPFLITENGSQYIFFEDYDYKTRHGVIAVGRLDADRFTYVGEALRANCHLSYPYLFRAGGEIYMLPETVNNKRLEVWRCVSFPLQWELYSTALEGTAPADSVLFERAGQWWLFTNLSTDSFGDHCDLHVFQADGPALKTLIAHSSNPVVTDSATGRNGGRVFERAGKLYRSSQNNSFGTYGYGVNLMEIETLSLEAYREKLVRKIEPDFAPDLIGCHHMDGVSSRWVLDARKRWGGFPRQTRSTPGV